MYLSEALIRGTLEAPVCAAFRLGLCIIQPLRGCTFYSVSIMLCYPYKVHSEATYPLNSTSRSTLHVHVLLWCLGETQLCITPD